MPAQLEYKRTRVLITVKTYPHPSAGSTELVCCAGITEASEFIRIYPVDFRYRPKSQQFSKYQWIEVDLAPRPRNKDWRKNSRQPMLHTLQVGSIINTGPKSTWERRSKVIDLVPHHTMLQLSGLYEEDRTSLGVVRPTEVLDLEATKCSAQWSKKDELALNQINLFGERPKFLHKIPYRFRFVFRCEDSVEPHACTLTDWEMGMLFINQRRKYNELTAVAHVKEQFLDKMCSPDRDTRFYVGTMLPRNDWLALGVYWPPSIEA